MFVTPRPDVSFHPLTTGGVLSRKGSHRIWTLNETSAFIWCRLSQVDSLAELVGCLTEAFPVSEERARRDARAMLAGFEREGLLAGAKSIGAFAADERWDIAPTGPALAEPTRWAVRRFFRVANHVFEFCCADPGLGEAFMRLVSHLELRDAGFSDTRLAVLPGDREPRTWEIYLDGLRSREGLAMDAVLPHLATVVFVRSCEALKEHLLLHAAVVARDGGAVIFPGAAGSGKTTLAATLMAQGYSVLSDELAVLNVDTLCVSPLPLPMSIKPRSVGPLSRYYPSLADAAVHLREDGKTVRYLSPWCPPSPAGTSSATPVALLVFPRYRPGVANRLAPIEETETLQRLAKTGSSNRALTHEDVAAMAALVRSNPCYELVYSDVCQAAAQLEPCVRQRHLQPSG